MADLSWLTARPIAHRGLHDASKGIVENTRSAVSAALVHGFGIEVDLQLSADSEAVVFHDDTLDRLTDAHGAVSGRSLAELRAVRYKHTDDRIQTLGELAEQVDGRTTLVVELKSSWSGQTALADRAADVLGAYSGPVAVMSFDPSLIATMRRRAPKVVRGIVACAFDDAAEWPELTAWQRLRLRLFAHVLQTAPQFVSYDIEGLQSTLPRCLRAVGIPLLTWTVRSEDDAAYAAKWADQITFEGYLPGT